MPKMFWFQYECGRSGFVFYGQWAVKGLGEMVWGAHCLFVVEIAWDK